MAYFKAIMRVQYGECQESKEYLLEAKTPEEARQAAEQYARGYYDEDPAEDNGVYYHNGGAVATQIRGVHETSLLGFFKDCLSRYIIKGAQPDVKEIVV